MPPSSRPSLDPNRRISAAHLLARRSASYREETGDNLETSLERTLQRIGMGRYQWTLLVLCVGWAADNLWLQSIAVILPRVQRHFGVSDRWIGLLPSSMFFGMTIGAWGWGSYSDAFGRRKVFNLTLLLGSVFGAAAGFAPTFPILCLCMLGVGLGVGGSMPTDGTLFLENISQQKHYLLTGLSAFFSIGSVVAGVLALSILPSRSCPEGSTICDVETQNTGWRVLLRATSILTFSMLLCRTVLFTIHESPAWLVNTGRHDLALANLQAIAKTNKKDLHLVLDDVKDADDEMAPLESRNYDGSRPPSPEAVIETPSYSFLPKSANAALAEYFVKINKLFTKEWRQTTILVWSIWGLVSAAYTIFNAFLPSWLERKGGGTTSEEESLQEFLYFTIGGLPGAPLGAWLVQTSLGRRKSMALSTLVTAAAIVVFAHISSKMAIIMSTSVVNLGGTLTYAIIYSFTPEVFRVDVRGTATGAASAISRIAGILAPLISGLLLAFNANFPLYASAIVFVCASACMISLPFEAGSR